MPTRFGTPYLQINFNDRDVDYTVVDGTIKKAS